MEACGSLIVHTIPPMSDILRGDPIHSYALLGVHSAGGEVGGSFIGPKKKTPSSFHIPPNSHQACKTICGCSQNTLKEPFPHVYTLVPSYTIAS